MPIGHAPSSIHAGGSFTACHVCRLFGEEEIIEPIGGPAYLQPWERADLQYEDKAFSIVSPFLAHMVGKRLDFQSMSMFQQSLPLTAVQV